MNAERAVEIVVTPTAPPLLFPALLMTTDIIIAFPCTIDLSIDGHAQEIFTGSIGFYRILADEVYDEESSGIVVLWNDSLEELDVESAVVMILDGITEDKTDLIEEVVCDIYMAAYDILHRFSDVYDKTADSFFTPLNTPLKVGL